MSEASRLTESGPVVVVGAGQAGALLAIYLARGGNDVVVYESRPDLRRVDIDAGRSINLALATRGIVPHRVAYEDLVRDLDGTVRRVLQHLDVPDAATVPLPPPDLARQADAVSAAWIERYQQEGRA